MFIIISHLYIDLVAKFIAMLIIRYLNKIKSNPLHAVSRRQQGRQREPSVETYRSPLFAEFWRHCVLSGGTQRRSLPRHKSEEMNI